MTIDSDSLGFLIGERRLRELAAGINQTEDNTKQMIKVLADSFEELQRTLSESTNIRDAASRQNRNGGSQDASGTPDADRLTRAHLISRTYPVPVNVPHVRVTPEGVLLVQMVQVVNLRRKAYSNILKIFSVWVVQV